MASITKRLGNWQARTNCKGIRRSATFATKAEAQAWATQIESEILAGKNSKIMPVNFGKLLTTYLEKVSPTKKGERWERIKILNFCKDDIAKVQLSELSTAHFAKWRDKRLKDVSPATVRREWNLLSSAINTAIKEWGWLKESPLIGVKRPESPPARDRILLKDDIEKLCYTLGYEDGKKPKTASSRVAIAMLFAIETGMRAGEIKDLQWSDIDGNVASIRKGKTKAATRKVPLSKEAIRLLKQLSKDGESCFDLESSQLDSLFRKARDKALIKDLHFHDTRHTAVTRLAQKLGILDLAKMIGHKDLSMLQLYYNESASDIAKKLG